MWVMTQKIGLSSKLKVYVFLCSRVSHKNSPTEWYSRSFPLLAGLSLGQFHAQAQHVDTSLGVLLDVEVQVAVGQVQQGLRSRPGERCHQQNRRQLESLPFIGKPVDIRGPVVTDELDEIVRLHEGLLDLLIVQAIFFRQWPFNEL